MSAGLPAFAQGLILQALVYWHPSANTAVMFGHLAAQCRYAAELLPRFAWFEGQEEMPHTIGTRNAYALCFVAVVACLGMPSAIF